MKNIKYDKLSIPYSMQSINVSKSSSIVLIKHDSSLSCLDLSENE